MGEMAVANHVSVLEAFRHGATMTPVPGPVSSVPTWLKDLAPISAQSPVESACSRVLHATAVRAVGRPAVDWGVELGLMTAERIVRDAPIFGLGDESADILRMGVESTILQTLILLSGVELDDPVTEEALACVADFARRDISLDEVLRGIQLGQAVMSREFLTASELYADPETKIDEIHFLSGWMFEFFEDLAVGMAAHYQLERARQGTRDGAMRLRLVSGILGDSSRAPLPQPRELATATQRLRYDFGATHVALVLWCTPRTADTPPVDLEHAAGELLAGMGCTQRLIMAVSPGQVWAWGTAVSSEIAASRFDVLEPPRGVRAVMGNPSPGVEGFRRSHREAMAAHRLLLTLPVDAPAVAYESVDLLSLLLTDRERAVDFARRELGALSVSTPQAADLRLTLATLLSLQGNAQATSHRLFISRNTVAYRIRRAEELMGRAVTTRPQQLHAALAIVTALGSLD